MRMALATSLSAPSAIRNPLGQTMARSSRSHVTPACFMYLTEGGKIFWTSALPCNWRWNASSRRPVCTRPWRNVRSPCLFLSASASWYVTMLSNDAPATVAAHSPLFASLWASHQRRSKTTSAPRPSTERCNVKCSINAAQILCKTLSDHQKFTENKNFMNALLSLPTCRCERLCQKLREQKLLFSFHVLVPKTSPKTSLRTNGAMVQRGVLRVSELCRSPFSLLDHVT